jgi:hypothetical protein
MIVDRKEPSAECLTLALIVQFSHFASRQRDHKKDHSSRPGPQAAVQKKQVETSLFDTKPK